MSGEQKRVYFSHAQCSSNAAGGGAPGEGGGLGGAGGAQVMLIDGTSLHSPSHQPSHLPCCQRIAGNRRAVEQAMVVRRESIICGLSCNFAMCVT